jgi:DNA-binding MarR family transcriptional regulator
VAVPAEQAVQAPPTDQVTRDIAAFSAEFIRLMRARQRALAAAKDNVRWAASVIISCVANGPLRASALAENVQSDPSTISRQVAALVREGLLERRADPVDGRASLLVTTPKGDAAHREQIGMRTRHFARMLADWDERDVRQFTALLRRFTDDFERYGPQFHPGKDQTNAEES